eukprot:766851-Hanusia_phi.AAC.2
MTCRGLGRSWETTSARPSAELQWVSPALLAGTDPHGLVVGDRIPFVDVLDNEAAEQRDREKSNGRRTTPARVQDVLGAARELKPLLNHESFPGRFLRSAPPTGFQGNALNVIPRVQRVTTVFGSTTEEREDGD